LATFIKHAIGQGWLEMHESGPYVRLLPAGSDLLGTARISSFEPPTHKCSSGNRMVWEISGQSGNKDVWV